MGSRPTDHANCDLTQLNLDVAFGRAGGQVIWQPRILAWYADRIFSGAGLPGRYRGMTSVQLYRDLGCSNRVYEFNACIQPVEDPAVRRTRREISDTEYEVVWDTPVGRQTAVYRISANSPWHMPVKYPIADEAEMRVAAWRESHLTFAWDQATYDRLSDEWARLGAPQLYMPRASIQHLIVDQMGTENTMYAVVDYPATVEAYFEALAVRDERFIEVLDPSPIQIVNFGDNVHAGIVSPRLFEMYLLPVYQRRNALLHAAGKFTHAHWDGDCGPILRYARDTGLDGIEAITPVPQGDVTLEQTREALGEMFLLDGIPAVLFDTTFPEQDLIDCVRKCIDLFAPHLILGISDEISSTGDIERIRVVTQVVDDYNASLG